MKYLFLLISTTVIMLSPLSNIVSSSEERKMEPISIATYRVDVTGDGLNETIELKGILLSQESNYYREVWADISSINSEQWRINYKGGYEPELQPIDINHNNTSDLFYRNVTDENGKMHTSHIHTIKNGKIEEIPLPKQRNVKGDFRDKFKVEIKISPNRKSNMIDVEKRAADYIWLGIYNKQGDLQKPTSVQIDPINSIEPILISKNNGFGLKSHQQISGPNNTVVFGAIETLWYYEKDAWIILQTKWVDSN